MKHFLLVCLGGALGTGLRHLLNQSLPLLLGTTFPYATPLVNLLASFLLGALMVLGLNADWLSPTTRLMLCSGLLGGLSSYSSFNYETLELFRQGAWGLGSVNLGLTVGGCLLAGLAGLGAGHWLTLRF